MSDNDIHRYLDGEAGLEALSDEGRAEARSWDRMLDAFRATRPTTPAPPWLEDRVMGAIEALPEPGLPRRIWTWLLRPQPVRLSPALVGLAATAMVALALVSRSDLVRMGPEAARSGPAVVYVQFDLDAPRARSVAVGGDFDEWQGSYALEDPDGDGVWTGRVPVKPGIHTYMFLVDGSQWVTDPRASYHTDDGFGNENAVLAVAAPMT